MSDLENKELILKNSPCDYSLKSLHHPNNSIRFKKLKGYEMENISITEKKYVNIDLDSPDLYDDDSKK